MCISRFYVFHMPFQVLLNTEKCLPNYFIDFSTRVKVEGYELHMKKRKKFGKIDRYCMVIN